MTTLGTRTVSVYPFRRGPAGVEYLTLFRSRHLELAGTWQAVHGRLEPGETAVAAARRELREETGLVPLRLFAVDHVEVLFDAAADQVVFVPVFAAEVSAEAAVTISAEHEAAAWCDRQETLRRLIWPTQRAAIERIAADVAETAQPNPWLEIR